MIHMQQNLIDFHKYNISYQIGNVDIMKEVQEVLALQPFDEKIVNFLNIISKKLLTDQEAKIYPDVITLAFWMRRASVEEIKKRFCGESKNIYKMGRGVVFHIAPSNVPVNYAYSLVSGLLCGNANVVRIPSKDFPQVRIINRAICNALNECPEMIPYVVLVKYGHDNSINDVFSAIADIRIVWGGDATIAELRKSPLKPRATEITFADRYSLSVIDADVYLKMDNKTVIANQFYNDTYLTDQNACTSPRIVVWTGENISEAKELFWGELHRIVETKYELHGVQAVNKLTSAYILSVVQNDVKKVKMQDNLIVRMQVKKVSSDLMKFKDNSGYFFEYDCKNIIELKELCNDIQCQTLSYIGNPRSFLPLLQSGIKGVDRIVPVGKTMDFDFIWDGYDLFERMTRNISIQ